MTPRVRLEVMDSSDVDYQTNRPEKEFPLSRTKYEKLFLDAKKGQLSPNPFTLESSVSYNASKGLANFVMKFDEDTELTGYMKWKKLFTVLLVLIHCVICAKNQDISGQSG